MTNREKAIKGLECCLANRHNNYPYKSTDEGIDKVTPCTTYLMQDALDLLEARAPTLTGGPRNPTEARVMKAFGAYLDKACKDQTIHDPTAWALYQTWRDFDGRKGRRA